MAEKKGGDLKAFYVVLGVTALIAVAAFGWSASRSGLSGVATQPIDAILEAEIADIQALVDMAAGVVRGDPEAPIMILEFGDFQCPACQQFATEIKPQIDLAFVEEGVSRFVFHDFPLVRDHPHAFLAARAARCARDQGEQYFWPYHDRLFSLQSIWSVSQAPPLSAFENYAATIGLNTEVFEGCLRSDRYADVVSANMRLGRELGVNRTPTILVSKEGGRSAVRMVGVSNFEGFQEVIDRLLEEEDEGDGL